MVWSEYHLIFVITYIINSDQNEQSLTELRPSIWVGLFDVATEPRLTQSAQNSPENWGDQSPGRPE